MERQFLERIDLGGKPIGADTDCFIVAEISANHNQSFDRAVELVREAQAAGADAVKLQTYTADTITLECAGDPFQISGAGPWAGRTLYDLYQEAYTPWEWQPRLKKVADEIGILLFSTPFDETAVDFLEEMNVPAYKVASFELVDLPLIRRIAATGKPMIMSTGMAVLSEIGEAVAAAREAGCSQLALLKCTSSYPAPPGEMNLRTIPHLAQAFRVPAGLSDHTLGISAPVAAVVLGASIVEKHFTLSGSDSGPDSAFSLEPSEFRAMVDAIRVAEKAVGKVNYEPTGKEMGNRSFRRSLFVVDNIEAGEKLTRTNVRSIRPAHGLHPSEIDRVIGRRAKENIARGTPLSWDLVD